MGMGGSIKYAVLGMLVERRGYGYDLVQRLSERLGPAWQLNPSAVYAALDQLEDEGLILATERNSQTGIERRSRRAARVTYEPTESGIAQFESWIGRPSIRPEPIRSEMQLKIALARPTDIPALLASITHAEWITTQLRQECLAAFQPLASNGDLDATPWPETVAALANAATLGRLEAGLAWMKVLRDTLQAMNWDHHSLVSSDVTVES
jgi:DNA-binding PadR family transcriptional regulator